MTQSEELSAIREDVREIREATYSCVKWGPFRWVIGAIIGVLIVVIGGAWALLSS